MASPPFVLSTNPGTPTSGRVVVTRNPVIVGRYDPLHGQPTSSEPDEVVALRFESDLAAERGTARETIEACARMPENWDGYGALRIRAETAQNALDVLEVLPDEVPTPDVTPNPNGTLSFEWESASGVGHLEIGRTRFSFYIQARHLDHPVLKDWRRGEPVPNVGQLLINHLYPMVPHGRIIVALDLTRSPTAERYFLPENPDAHFSVAS